MFVTPYTRCVVSSLDSAGFTKNCFHVPFSNGYYPKAEQSVWETLWEKARKSYAEEFVEDCISYCDEHYIGTISDEILDNCFEMPETGVKVKHFYYESCYYPIINNNCLDCVAAEKLGHFCTNNGKVVFV